MNWYKRANNDWKQKSFDVMKGVGWAAAIGAPLMLGLHGLRNYEPTEKRPATNNADQQPPHPQYAEPPSFAYEPVAQQPTQTAAPRQSDQPLNNQPPKDDFYDGFLGTLSEYEGVRPRAYKDGNGVVTVGIGHAMGKSPSDPLASESQRAFQQVFGDSVSWDRIFSGEDQLTPEQIKELAKYDVDRHVERASRILPRFNDYPDYLRQALLNAIYRGDLGRRTAALINEGRWEEAADEYINRRDYRDAIKNRQSGIRKRMDANREAMLRYIEDMRSQ